MSEFMRRLYGLRVCVGVEDRHVWSLGKGGEFSVKSCYDFFNLAP